MSVRTVECLAASKSGRLNSSNRKSLMTGSWIQTAPIHNLTPKICIYFYDGVRGKKKSKIKIRSSITNIWRNGCLPWQSVPIRFQIYGNITVLAPAAHLSNVRPIYLLAFSTGCHTNATPPARATASVSVSVFLSLHLPVCLNITIWSYKNAQMCDTFFKYRSALQCHPCPGRITSSGHVEVRSMWGVFFDD